MAVSVSKEELRRIMLDVFNDTELEPKSFNDYEQDIKEIAGLYEVDEKGLSNVIPELTKP